MLNKKAKISVFIISFAISFLSIQSVKADTYFMSYQLSYSSSFSGGSDYVTNYSWTEFYLNLQTDKSTYNKGENLIQISSITDPKTCYHNEVSQGGDPGIIYEGCDFEPNVRYTSRDPILRDTSYGQGYDYPDIYLSGNNMQNANPGFSDTITLPTVIDGSDYYTSRYVDLTNYTNSTVATTMVFTAPITILGCSTHAKNPDSYTEFYNNSHTIYDNYWTDTNGVEHRHEDIRLGDGVCASDRWGRGGTEWGYLNIIGDCTPQPIINTCTIATSTSASTSAPSIFVR